MQPQERIIVPASTVTLAMQPVLAFFARHWLALANLSWAVVAGVPWLAPVLMKLGVVSSAKVIYYVYSFLCHQLANRSFFLFGEKAMYGLTELTTQAPETVTWSGLGGFIGSPGLGYKVAWSDRMVTMSIGILVGGLVFALLRRSLRPLDWRVFVLLSLPLGLDGLLHFVSDLAGLGRGFRYANAWLVAVTGNRMPQSFYQGNGIGSFNSMMRIWTGIVFGLGMIWLVYPHLERSFRQIEGRSVGQVRPLAGQTRPVGVFNAAVGDQG